MPQLLYIGSMTKKTENLKSIAKPDDVRSDQPRQKVGLALYAEDVARLEWLAAELTDGNRSMLVRKLLREEAERRS